MKFHLCFLKFHLYCMSSMYSIVDNKADLKCIYITLKPTSNKSRLKIPLPTDSQHSLNEVRRVSVWKVLSSYITIDTNGQLQLMSQMMTPPRSALLIIA